MPMTLELTGKDALEQALANAIALNEAGKTALNAASVARETVFKGAFGCSFPVTAHRRNHRRNHRPGRPPKIEADPELQAFISARIDRLTFVEIAASVVDAFPPNRRVGKSAIHAWWKRSNRRIR